MALPALLALFSVVGGCDSRLATIDGTLIVHNYGLFDAEVSWTLRYAFEDDNGEETTDTIGDIVDLPAGRTYRQDMNSLVSLHLEVRRTENGMILLAETYHPEDFSGSNNELEIVVRP